MNNLDNTETADKARVAELQRWLDDPLTKLTGIVCNWCGRVFSRFIDYSAHCICNCPQPGVLCKGEAMWHKASSFTYKCAMIRMPGKGGPDDPNSFGGSKRGHPLQG